MMTERSDAVRPIVILLCKILLAEYVIGFVAWYLLADGLKDFSGTPLGADYIDIYAAGWLADHGMPDLVYNLAQHHQIEKLVAGYDVPYFAWHYPPIFLSVAAVFALLPYLTSFFIYLSVGYAALLQLARRILPQGEIYLYAALAYPGAFINIINGQNGFITAGLFGGGLLALEKRPWLAGLLFGLLSNKPQFFVLIPVVLIAAGYWRCVFASVLAACLTAALSWLAFGTDTWLAFFNSTHLTQHLILEQGSTGWQKIQSVFAMARMGGADITTAYTLQFIAAILAVIATIKIWRKVNNLSLRSLALAAAVFLTTPYCLDYDLVLFAIPLALIAAEANNLKDTHKEIPFLIALWILPFLARGAGVYHIPLTPPLMIATLYFCYRKMQELSSKMTYTPST